MSDKPTPVEQRDREAAAAYLKANERYWIDRVTAIFKDEPDPLVQAFANHRIKTLSQQPGTQAGETEALAVLSSLSSYLAAGLGDEATTAEQFDARIRWGIDHWTVAVIQRCADIVEECSKRPNMGWGEVKKRILALKPEYEASVTATRAAAATPSKGEIEAIREALQEARTVFECFTIWEAPWGPESHDRIHDNSARLVKIIDQALSLPKGGMGS